MAIYNLSARYMLKSFLMLVFALSGSGAAAAAVNDGVFYSRGGTLVPLEETQISLSKELLKFYISDFEFMDVEVNFEFFNPGAGKTVTVGFVTPPASGDVDESENHPRISKFTVFLNDRRIPFKVAKLKESSFRSAVANSDGDDFVYYFPVTFKPGINKIKHTYRFMGGASVDTQRDFEYQITTGRRWANKQIDEFELQIHLDRGVFFIPLGFREDGARADWQIIGRGSFSKPQPAFGSTDEPSTRLVQLQNGYLSLKETNFKPDFDISIGEYNWSMGWFTKMCKDAGKCPAVGEIGFNLFQYFRTKPSEFVTEEELSGLSGKDLSRIRNFPYAIRGYAFNSPELNRFFSQFFWYLPDPELTFQNISLSTEEEEFLKKVLRVEKGK